MYKQSYLDQIQEITLSNGKKAKLLITPRHSISSQIISKMDLGEVKALIVVVGSTAEIDPAIKQPLFQLFSRGLAQAVRQTGAIIMDGATNNGIFAILGQALSEPNNTATHVIGVAPLEKLNRGGELTTTMLGLHHTHFVLVKDVGDWGDETETLLNLAAHFAATKPAITLVVGGGEITRQEVLGSVRSGWPIIVVKGSGRLADQLTEQFEAYQDNTSWQEIIAFLPFSEDSELAEIVTRGELYFVSLNQEKDTIGQFEQLLLLLLSRPNVS